MIVHYYSEVIYIVSSIRECPLAEVPLCLGGMHKVQSSNCSEGINYG